MVTLLGELCRRHPEVSLGLAITADEERGSHHGTRYLVDQELSCDLAILPDGGLGRHSSGRGKRACCTPTCRLDERLALSDHPGLAGRVVVGNTVLRNLTANPR